jgi:hypothetical protein
MSASTVTSINFSSPGAAPERAQRPIAAKALSPSRAGDRPNRVFIIDGEDSAARRTINRAVSMLGERIGSGGFHVARAVDVFAAEKSGAPRWVALMPNGRPGVHGGVAAWPLAQREHEHNLAVTAAAPELLPRYAGLAVVDGRATGPDANNARALRYAQVWERKDATFRDIVQQGGLSGEAELKGQRITGADVVASLSLLAAAYRKLHDKAMAYTDPKDGNVAFDIASQAQPGMPVVKNLVFIDAESMQRPGYVKNDDISVNRAFTPAWIAKGVLVGAHEGQAKWKKAQGAQANDVFHMAAIGFGLVTGKAPQQDLARRRFEQQAWRAGLDLGDGQSREVMKARMMAGHEEDLAMLDRSVQRGLITAPLAKVLGDGLEGRIRTISAFARRIAAISDKPA